MIIRKNPSTNTIKLLFFIYALSSSIYSATVDLGVWIDAQLVDNTDWNVLSGTEIASTNDLFGTGQGTTASIRVYHSGAGTANPFNNGEGADIDTGLATRSLGDWAFICIDIDLGSEVGTTLIDGQNLVSAADFSLNVSSQNGGSNYYEWGGLALKNSLGASMAPNFNATNIANYLGDTTNYDSQTDGDQEIGTALGANVANDSFNMFANTGSADNTFATNSTSGNNGTENSGSHNLWNNDDFGLEDNTGISGFTAYWGLGISNPDSQRSGPGGSWGNLSFPDAPSVPPIAIPEPSGGLLLFIILVNSALFSRTRYRQ